MNCLIIIHIAIYTCLRRRTLLYAYANCQLYIYDLRNNDTHCLITSMCICVYAVIHALGTLGTLAGDGKSWFTKVILLEAK